MCVIGGVGGKKIWIVCHDSSIRTSIVRERERGVCICACACARARVRVSLIGSPPSSPAIISLPSACARTYNASRAFSSAIRFARERSASVSCARKNEREGGRRKKRKLKRCAHPGLHVDQRRLGRFCRSGSFRTIKE